MLDEERKLYQWRAWSKDDQRICDCGCVWGLDEGDAEQIARMALGGPYMRDVVRFQIERVKWPSAPHGRQVTTTSDRKR